MRKRVEIAKILIQTPAIAIIDEPTAQIDVVGKHRIWNMIRDLRDEDSTILLATNDLYEADVLSNRVAVMHKGQLLVCDEPKKLKDTIPGGDIIEVVLRQDLLVKSIERLKKIDFVVDIFALEPNHVKIYLNHAKKFYLKSRSFSQQSRCR